MDRDITYDPVTALSEVDARGDTAKIFSDIRATMNIPILTSIWRGLADIDGALSGAWNNIKPMYHSNSPADVLEIVIKETALPKIDLNGHHSKSCSLDLEDLRELRKVVKAYNRSNGLNFVTMNALIATDSEVASSRCYKTKSFISEKIIPLMERNEISDDIWQLVITINSLGSAFGNKSHVATLWRHLAHWPLFLSLAHAALLPLEKSRQLYLLSERIVEVAKLECKSIETIHCDFDGLSDQVQAIIMGYATSPGQVARMIVLGNILENWLTDQFNL